MGRDHWTSEEYRRFLETGKEPAALPAQNRIAVARTERVGRIEQPDAPKKTKYSNEKEIEDGITFDSKHEHNVYRWLKSRRNRGELRWVFVHVPFRFMSGVVYWADFLTVLTDGTVEAVWDAKSEITAKNKDYVIKKKLLLTEWGISVREVMRSDYDGQGGFYNPAW